MGTDVEIKRKMHFTGEVVKITLTGAFVDIGLDRPGYVHISRLRKEPTQRVEDVVEVGQKVDVWARRVDPKTGIVDLTMIKPLDLEWREIKKGMVVKGKVVKIENYGVFVDIGAERPAMVHISEMTHDFIKHPSEVVSEGDEVEGKVILVNRRKKQIKLSMKALQEPPVKLAKKVQKAAAKEAGEEPLPTAFELALREALERAKREESARKRKELAELERALKVR